MKVLLIGDYSTVHVNLAYGLRALGVQVDLVSSGDGFKKTENDICLPRSRLKKIFYYKNLLQDIKKYDLVQLMSDSSMSLNLMLNWFVIREISKKVPIYLVAAGCDYTFWTKGEKILNMPLFSEVRKYKEPGAFDRFSDRIRNYFTLKHVSGIIGFNEYFEIYKTHAKSMSPIVLPMVYEKVEFIPMNWADEPLVVLHGIQSNRKGFKGSYTIEKAFEILNERYSPRLQCMCVGDMPYAQYKKILEKCHILVDQTNGISFGMNALLGMAMGKVVCCSSQLKQYYDRWLPLVDIEEYPPIIPLAPDVDFIVSQIENLFFNRNSLKAIAENSRRYAEKYHDSTKVAKMFLERWGFHNSNYIKGNI